MNRLDLIAASHGPALQVAGDRFGDHEDMSAGLVLAWVSQFADEHLPVALHALQSIRYLNTTNLREMARQLRDIVLSEYTAAGRILFVPVGGPGDGSGYLARVLKALRDRHIEMATVADLGRFSPEEIDVVVFLDDFSGTGSALAEWWVNAEPLVLPLNAKIVMGLLMGTDGAVAKISSFAEPVVLDELGDEANVWSDSNTTFDPSAKAILLRYCEATGCSPDFVRGFGSSGLLIAFRHGCPNNSLPILWFGGGSEESWRPLFHRRQP